MKNLTPAELAAVGAVDRDRISDDLAALVAIPSVTGEESAVQTEVALRMTTAGLVVERTEADPAAVSADPDFPGMEAARTALPVVAGRLAGEEPGRRVMVAGHIDVVPPGDPLQWTHPPFSPAVEDGSLYGRGACDMKAGVVAGLAALRALRETEAELQGEAVLLTVPAEEDGGAGMLAAIRNGHTASAAVITEPTRLEIVTAQAGAITFTLTVSGRGAHAAFRAEGVSAVDKLRLLMAALEVDEAERNEAETNPQMRSLRLPYPTSIGRLTAGEWSSSVPDLAVAEGRYGVRVGESAAQAEEQLRKVIARACAGDDWLREHPAELEVSGGRFASAALPAEHPLPWGLGAAARDVLGRLPPFTGVPYGSDARLLIHQGATPCVLYGPGDPRLAHTPDEHVPLDDVVRCARVLAVWVIRSLHSEQLVTAP
ncbi:MAG TPA: ArgE/DapE family deacylase [Gaiellales bacterium]|jgi:acetylornithine deacetylase|nr:ArgE/DapE family deacylase [Gaiellales bacterium]